MAVLIADIGRDTELENVLLAYDFVYSRRWQRWECRNLSRAHEQKLRQELPELALRLSVAESRTLHLTPASSQYPAQFWIASNIASRNLLLLTPWNAEQPQQSIAAAITDAAGLLGCRADEIEVAAYLQAKATEGQNDDQHATDTGLTAS